jgi:hypothetical protein
MEIEPVEFTHTDGRAYRVSGTNPLVVHWMHEGQWIPLTPYTARFGEIWMAYRRIANANPTT